MGLFGKKHQKPAESSQVISAAPVPQAAQGIDAKTVAIIMAAVSAASGISSDRLVYHAIRRVSGLQSVWANNALASLVNTRQDYI